MAEAQPEHEVKPILQFFMLVMYQKEGADLETGTQQLQPTSSGKTNEQLAIQVHSLPTSECKVLAPGETGAAIPCTCNFS